MPLKLTLSKRFLVIPLTALVLAGCGKSEPEYVEVTEVEPAPDTETKSMEAMQDHAAHMAQSTEGIGFAYSVPEAWVEKPPSSMKLLSMEAGNPPELVAECSVSAFPGDVGGQLANINRWRRQVGLGPLSPEAAGEFVKEAEISGMEAWVVDFSGPAGTGVNGGSARVRVAVVSHAGKSWFFKLMGNDSAVEGELQGFESFLSSVKF